MATPHADLIQARRLSDRQPAMDIQRLGLGVRGPLTLPAPAPTHAPHRSKRLLMGLQVPVDGAHVQVQVQVLVYKVYR
jgi:hypothetical protein